MGAKLHFYLHRRPKTGNISKGLKTVALERGK